MVEMMKKEEKRREERGAADAVPSHLRVNLRRDAWSIPLDEDVRLSWRLPEAWRGISCAQEAYALRLYRGTGRHAVPVWESGWISDVCQCARPLLFALEAGGLYEVRVAVRAAVTGRGGVLESGWSEPCAFSAADVFRPSAVWPAAADGTPCPEGFVRQSFSLEDKDTIDRLLVTAAGCSPEAGRQYVYTLSLNGEALGVGATREGRDPQGRAVLYTQTFDATAHLRAGENVISALVSDPGEGRAFLCSAVAFFADGTRRELLRPDGWRGLDACAALRPAWSLGTGYYRAFAYNLDARAYPFGYAKAGYDDAGWKPCLAVGDVTDGRGGEAYVLRPSGTDPVGRFPLTDVTPVVVKLGEGHFAVDLGREIIGSIRLQVPPDWDGEADVEVRFGEQCRPEGISGDPALGGTAVKWNMQTGNRYAETWHLLPGVTVETADMAAVRFIELQGLPFELTKDQISGVAVRRAYDGSEASLETEDALLSDIYGLIRRTIEMTTQDIYVDSQSRERGAYEGDLLINQLASYVMEDAPAASRFSLEFLYTHRTWPAEYVLLICEAAWEDYMATGDASSLKAYWHLLRENQFLRFLDPAVGLMHSGNPGENSHNAILVDWPPSERDGYDVSVTYNTVFNCVAVVGLDALTKIAGVVGDAETEKEFAALSASVKAALIGKVYDPLTGDVYDGVAADGSRSPHVSQHAMAYALYAGVYKTQEDADRIARRLMERGGGKIRMSVYGAFFLLLGLCRAGHGDEAARLMLDPADTLGERTWAYMLHRAVGEGRDMIFGEESDGVRTLGATLTAEAWNSRNKPNMTFSHPWGAAPAAVLVRGLLGVTPLEPGYRRVRVSPTTTALKDLTLSLPTAAGPFTLSLTNNRLSVTAPAGCEVVVG